MSDKPRQTFDQIVLAANAQNDVLRAKLADLKDVLATIRGLARRAMDDRDRALQQRDDARAELARRGETKPTTQDLIDATRELLWGVSARARVNGSIQHH